MKRKTLLTLGLGLTVALGLGSCKDNDLADGGQNPGGTEQDDALAQKYQTLQNLLGALASVDSLPDNWNSSNYNVPPTVGVLKDDATPHIRYVVTTSQAEADRIYRSYLMKDVTGTPTDDSWQMQGIGSMQFKLENDPNLYATLKVNVQQLPALEEIRFVSEDALGSNGLISPTGCYYSFGDVVFQNLQGAPTFWVCVRPCSMSPKRRQSHWCTFQLVPAGEPKLQNYLKTKGCVLPTRLAFDRSDAEKHIQNFFNVLRIMADPDVALSKNYKGIDDISSTNTKNTAATWADLRTTSFMWDYIDLWNPAKVLTLTDPDTKLPLDETKTGGVLNLDHKIANDFKNFMGKEEGLSLDAFYYGYTTNYFSKGDYTVYNLQLTAPAGDPFTQVKKQTGYVEKSDYFDFSHFVTGDKAGESNATPVHFSQDVKRTGYQFVVKYRTGAELEGLSQGTNDVNPAESFSKRDATNYMQDILVSGNWRDRLAYDGFNEGGAPKNENIYPFFAFGDVVRQTEADYQYNLAHPNDPKKNPDRVCIRNAAPVFASDVFNYSTDAWKTQAMFVATHLVRTYISDEGVSLSKNDLKAVLYTIFTAMVRSNKGALQLFDMKPLSTLDAYEHELSKLAVRLEKYVLCKLESNVTAEVNGKDVKCGRFTVEFKDKDGNYNSLVYTQMLGGENDKVDYKYSVVKQSQAQSLEGQMYGKLCFYTYDDVYAFRDNYSHTRTISSPLKKERRAIQEQNAQWALDAVQNIPVRE